jgi:PKHD-type hydroxylase
MILCMAEVLSPEELSQILELAEQGEFIDGKLTAGWHAQMVKHNQQLCGGSEIHKTLVKIVMSALQRNELFQMAARPRTILPPLFSRYDLGMAYGSHVDNAVMTCEGHPVRTDLSFTLFLSSPDSYEGGELIIETVQGEEAFKLEAGSLVLYPASTLHRVEPVTSGQRLVAVSWMQSMIRSPEHREILFELDTVRRSLFKQQGKTNEFDLLTKSLANLIRLWVEI